jgi:hypothetical protein
MRPNCQAYQVPSSKESDVRIRAGYDIAFRCAQEVPMVQLTVHRGRQADLLTDRRVVLYHGPFGNVCTRLVAPTGLLEIPNEFVIEDSGLPDWWRRALGNSMIHDLPDDVS